MKISFSALATCAFLLLTKNNYAMKAPEPPKIYAYNTLSGYFLSLPIQVSYNFRGKTINRDINPDEAQVLGSGDGIRADLPITFSGRGAIKGKTVKAQSLTKPELVAEWLKVRQSDMDPLVITLSTSDRMFPYTLTLTYSTQLPENVVQKLKKQTADATHNVLILFPRIRWWELTDKITEDDVRQTRSWKDILVPGGRLANNTTAEDVYRYILGLDENLYTEKEVNDAYRALALEWHSDRVPEEHKPFADRVFILLKTAQDGLRQAIQEKPELRAHAAEIKQKEASMEEGWTEVTK